MDVEGNIYVAIPGFAILSALSGLPFSPLVRVDGETGEVMPLSRMRMTLHYRLPAGWQRRLPGDHKSVFMTNGAFRGLSPVPIPEPGPGIIQVGVGIRGRP